MVELAAALVTVLGTLFVQWQRSRAHGVPRLKELSDLHRALPDDAKSKHSLLLHIDEAVEDLIEASRGHRRDWFGTNLAAVLLLSGVWAGWFSLRGGWWWLLVPVAVVGVLFGVAGLTASLPKKMRDEKGNAVE